ncbi:MAG: hypothetical protein ABSD96_09990 [Candidatus Korobacteraceae bacterium]|jgi:hypothetical protein
MTRDFGRHIYIFLLLLVAPMLHAQGIAPIISEYGHGKVNGSFTVANSFLEPISVVIQEYSFSVNPDGKSKIRPLDPGIHIQLDSMSSKIGVKQQHEFSYKVKCDTLPCWGTFNASISGAHVSNGLGLVMIVPHTFYICRDKQAGCRDRIRHDVFHLEK